MQADAQKLEELRRAVHALYQSPNGCVGAAGAAWATGLGVRPPALTPLRGGVRSPRRPRHATHPAGTTTTMQTPGCRTSGRARRAGGCAWPCSPPPACRTTAAPCTSQPTTCATTAARTRTCWQWTCCPRPCPSWPAACWARCGAATGERAGGRVSAMRAARAGVAHTACGACGPPQARTRLGRPRAGFAAAPALLPAHAPHARAGLHAGLASHQQTRPCTRRPPPRPRSHARAHAHMPTRTHTHARACIRTCRAHAAPTRAPQARGQAAEHRHLHARAALAALGLHPHHPGPGGAGHGAAAAVRSPRAAARHRAHSHAAAAGGAAAHVRGPRHGRAPQPPARGVGGTRGLAARAAVDAGAWRGMDHACAATACLHVHACTRAACMHARGRMRGGMARHGMRPTRARPAPPCPPRARRRLWRRCRCCRLGP